MAEAGSAALPAPFRAARFPSACGYLLSASPPNIMAEARGPAPQARLEPHLLSRQRRTLARFGFRGRGGGSRTRKAPYGTLSFSKRVGLPVPNPSMVPATGVAPVSSPYERDGLLLSYAGKYWSRAGDVRSARLFTRQAHRCLCLRGICYNTVAVGGSPDRLVERAV